MSSPLEKTITLQLEESKFSESDITKDDLKVIVQLEIWDVGAFSIEENTIPIAFDLNLKYDLQKFRKLFPDSKTSDDLDTIPWAMPNALELGFGRVEKWVFKGPDTLDTKEDRNIGLSIYEKKDSYTTEYRIEHFECFAKSKITSFYSQDPFQSVFFIIKLAVTNRPLSHRVKLVPCTDNNLTGVRKTIGDFTLGEEKIRVVKRNKYRRLYFIWEYNKSPIEDLGKFYLLPYLINVLTIGFYENVDSLFDSSGAYFLAIIALLFTLPDLGGFTKNEKNIVMNSIFMLVILVTLTLWPKRLTQIILWIIISIICGFSAVYDFYQSKTKNEDYKHFLFEEELLNNNRHDFF